MKAGKIIKPNIGFTSIPNEILQRADLSWKAKGLYSYILSLPHDWAIYKLELQKHSIDGRDSTLAGFNELVKAGYIEEIDLRDEGGRFAGCNYLVNLAPKTPITGFPFTDKPITDKPITENPQLINKHNTKETLTNYYIISENLKIFQKGFGVEERYHYEQENFIFFTDGSFNKKIIVPQSFFLNFAYTEHKIQVEGFFRNYFGNYAIENRADEFMKIAAMVFSSYHANTKGFEDFTHFLNVAKKVLTDLQSKRGEVRYNKNKDFHHETNHEQGWT